MKNEELKERLISVLQEGAARGGIKRTTSYDEERENGVLVGITQTYTEVEIDFGVFADALIAAGLRFGENLTATFDHMALEREHELEHRLAEAEHRAEVAERALFLSAKEIEYLNGNFDSSAEFFAKEKVIPFLMRQAEKKLKGECKK